jgi:polyhydroxyalkanoate synthesis regulator phasin
MRKDTLDPDNTQRRSAPYWGAVLTMAIRDGDVERAEKARAALRRLGIDADAKRRKAVDEASVFRPANALTPTSEYQFRRNGENWLVGFDGQAPIEMDDSVGMKFIHTLLSRPSEWISGVELMGGSTEIAAGNDRNAQDARRVLSAKNVGDLARRASDLQAIIDEAEKNGSEVSEETIDELNEVMERLKSSSIAGDAKRDGKNAASNVQQRIKKVIGRLKIVAPESAHHLDGAIERGNDYRFIYRPSHPPLPWDLG